MSFNINLKVVSGNNSYIYLQDNIIKGGISTTKNQLDPVYFVVSTEYTLDHVLIENNEIEGGGHISLDIVITGGIGQYIVIRNNTFHNPNHTTFALYGTGSARPQYVLVANNRIYDAGANCGVDSCPANIGGSVGDRNRPREQHPNFQFSAYDTIVRNNTFYNGGRGIDIQNIATGNRIYNNVMYGNVHGIYFNTAKDIDNNVFKNNVFLDNNLQSTYANSPLYIFSLGTNCTNEWAYNNFDETNDINYKDCNYGYSWQTVSYLETNIPSILHDNKEYSSGFVDAPNYDFNLTSNSPMIDAGSFLTHTNGSGNNSNIIVVDDARYFMDGWDLIEGDIIQLEGQSKTVRIINVNYSTNTITVDQNVYWYDHQGVSLAYNGRRPDIGAHESLYISVGLSPPTNIISK